MIYEKLKTSVQQQNSDQDALESILQTESKMREEIDLLKVKLQNLKELKEQTISKKNVMIDTLKGKIY